MDPLDIAAKYGADAGRMALIIGTAPGTDSKISEDKIKGQKHFANKIWNMTRFIMTNTADVDMTVSYTTIDEALYKTWKEALVKITNDIDAYRLHTAAESLYQYIWTVFADEILESSKPLLTSTDSTVRASRQKLLTTLLSETLTALHPFMPFVTETIWEILPHKTTTHLMVTPWPNH